MSKLLSITQRTYAVIREVLQMKQKAILIKDFYNDKGALHRGEKVVIEGQAAEGFTRIVTGTGAVYVIPSHIIKKIP